MSAVTCPECEAQIELNDGTEIASKDRFKTVDVAAQWARRNAKRWLAKNPKPKRILLRAGIFGTRSDFYREIDFTRAKEIQKKTLLTMRVKG